MMGKTAMHKKRSSIIVRARGGRSLFVSESLSNVCTKAPSLGFGSIHVSLVVVYETIYANVQDVDT
jgi:hypothetical protein